MTDDPQDPTETAAAPSRDDRLMPEREAMTNETLGEEPDDDTAAPAEVTFPDGSRAPDPSTLPDEP